MKAPLIQIKNLHISISQTIPSTPSIATSLKTFATAPIASEITPPAIGAHWEGQGGIYAGMMRGEEDSPDYPLIVPTHESVLNHKAAYGGYKIDETDCTRRFDGLANTLALVNSDTDHPAAQWCHGLVVEGHNDLYLPSVLELALIAANLPDLFDKDWHLSSTQRSATTHSTCTSMMALSTTTTRTTSSTSAPSVDSFINSFIASAASAALECSMKQQFISVLISATLSACLLIGTPTFQDFSFYVLAFINVLAWIGVLSGLIKDEAAERVRKWVWISCASTSLQLYALIYSGHPLLAASNFLVSFFIVVLAFKSRPSDSGISA